MILVQGAKSKPASQQIYKKNNNYSQPNQFFSTQRGLRLLSPTLYNSDD